MNLYNSEELVMICSEGDVKPTEYLLIRDLVV